MMAMRDRPSTLVIEVVEVQGQCPVYRLGDRCRIEEGYKPVSGQPSCMHVLQSFGPNYVTLSRGIATDSLGLVEPYGAAYVQCFDPMRYTGGGPVTFRIASEEE